MRTPFFARDFRDGNRRTLHTMTKSKKKHNKSRSNKSVDTIKYTGPLKPIGANHQVTTFKKFGAYILAASSTAVGVINNAFVVSPSTLNDWGNLQNDWSEYRILAFQVKYMPLFKSAPNSTAAAIGGLLIGVLDRTSSTTALTTTSQALEFEGAKYGAINEELCINAKASGANELAWINITSSQYWASVRFYSTVLSTSNNYGNFIVSILVEFRSAL
jgi:hypothetical protein